MRVLLISLMMTLIASSAHAVTLTFDGVQNFGGFGPATIVEQGFEISGSPDSYVFTNVVHLDDGGTAYSNVVGFSAVSGSRFNAISALIEGLRQFSLDPYNDVKFEGTRGSAVVATQLYSTTSGSGTITLGADFTNLDSFIIEATSPIPIGDCIFQAPCSHFNVDDVVLMHAIPIPATFPLLVGGLLVMGLFRRRS